MADHNKVNPFEDPNFTPVEYDPQYILQVNHLKKYFPIKSGMISHTVGHVKAVDGVTFNLKRGTTMGLVGESGCGKTTTGRTILRLYDSKTAGQVLFNGQEVYDLSHATYSNVEQGALDFANKTLMPECDSLERALSAPIWAAGYEDCYVQVDMNGLLRGLYKDRMEGYRIAINAGFFCANDARTKEDLPPFVGGEVFFRQSSMVPVGPETGEELAERHNTSLSSAPATAPKQPDTADTSDVSGTALAVIHKDMRDRLRDRLEDKGDGPKLREFAEKVLTPLADAYEVAGIEYDLQSDIEEIING